MTPVGIFLPALDEFFLYGVTSKVTSDCLVDRLIQWWESVKERFAQIKTLVINLDNGPENHSHRTQFMQRLLEFAQKYQITIRLAYYPPYHSKYNPVERCWGILEHHWNGALLNSVDAVIHFAQTMTWKGNRPIVELVTNAYQTGVKLTKEAMQAWRPTSNDGLLENGSSILRILCRRRYNWNLVLPCKRSQRLRSGHEVVLLSLF